MIARIWHGWTKTENANAYEQLLRNLVFPSIAAKEIKGYKKISLTKRQTKNETEFVTTMIFESLDDVKTFVGDDYTKAIVPPEAQKLLIRFDKESTHYEILEEIIY